MKILLLITSSAEMAARFQSALPEDYIFLTADCLEKGADLLRTNQIHMVVIDLSLHGMTLSWLKRYRLIPDILWIGILPPDLSEDDLGKYHEVFHEVIYPPLSPGKIDVAIKKAEERQEIMRELKHLRLLSSLPAVKGSPEGDPRSLYFEPLEKAVSLSRIFTANLDLERLIGLFLDAVTDVIGVGRISFLLYDEMDGRYKIKVSRGLHPGITSSLYLSSDSGMVLWLSARGRILRRDRIGEELRSNSILARALREMEMLQCMVSIPILYEGRLLCILNLDSKVTGEPYSPSELEKIFVLSNYFGRAIQDIYTYHRVCYQKEYIQKILERMGSGVITVNEREEIILLNPKAEEILKVKAAELIGKTTESLPGPIADLIGKTVREGKVYSKHEVLAEGEGLFLEVDTYGLYDTAGRLMGGVILLDDISAKKELSREKKKGESLQVLNELVGRMAHELRNPLVAVRTFTQLMKDRYDDPEFQDFFYTTVTGEVEKLNNLIEKLIAFVHPIEYKFEVVDLGEVLDTSLETVLKENKRTNVHIVKNYTPGLFRLKADRAQICKAFSYILQNSFNAMASGGTLTIDVESLSRDGLLKVAVKDTGKGIPEEDLERVFDPFYTTPEKGVGLGLPLSQKIIEDHSGKLTISSIINSGTTLTVLLPIAATAGKEA